MERAFQERVRKWPGLEAGASLVCPGTARKAGGCGVSLGERGGNAVREAGREGHMEGQRKGPASGFFFLELPGSESKPERGTMSNTKQRV